MIAAIRLVRADLGPDAGLKKTQTEVSHARARAIVLFVFCFGSVAVVF